MKYFILVILFVFSFIMINAQSIGAKPDWENLVRNHPDFTSDAELQQDLILKIEFLMSNPISLNKADINELMQIPFMSLKSAASILQHRKEIGDFIAKEELMAVNNLSREEAKWIAIFVFVDKQILKKVPFQLNRSEHILDMAFTRVYHSKSAVEFPNQKFHDLYKLKFRINENWQLGFCLENDAGEQYKSLSKGIFDFQSFFLFYKGNSKLKKIAIGDYRLHYGQSLALGLGFAPGKGAQVLNAIRFAEGISRFNSFDESRFFRGAACSFGLKHFDLDLFYSNKPKDVNIGNDSLFTGTLLQTGLHRTESELANKNKMNEELMGFRIHFNKSGISGGLSSFYRQLSPEIQADRTKNYAFWNQSSARYLLFSADLKWRLKNTLFAAEMVFDNNRALSGQLCAVMAVNERFDLVFLFRNYAKNYVNPFANAMSEWSNQNEKGFYLGGVYKFTKNLGLSVYSDFYFSEWIKYRFPAQKWGFDQFAEIRYELRSGLKANLRMNKNTGEQLVENRIELQNQNSIRAQIQFKFLGDFEWMNRLEQIRKNNNKESKTGLYIQEIEWKKKKMSINFRYTVFHSQDHSSILYATESELSGVFGLNTYSGNGYSSFVLVQTHFVKMMKLGFKVGFYESDKFKNREFDMKIQMRMSL